MSEKVDIDIAAIRANARRMRVEVPRGYLVRDVASVIRSAESLCDAVEARDRRITELEAALTSIATLTGAFSDSKKLDISTALALNALSPADAARANV